jgi:hypothetical protein
MKHFTLTSFLLISFAITTQTRCMNDGPIGRHLLAKSIIDSDLPPGHPDACTLDDCAYGFLSFAASAAVGTAIMLAAGAASSVPIGTACAIILASGIPGPFLYGYCCRKRRNSQETT